MKPKVSVIVPVYNTEKYLEKCLNSLVQQTLDDIEIIVVDDGSLDNSQAIISKYVEQYPNKIISFKKENGGLGNARNYGLEYATGEFIGFVDSDDYVDTKMYEAMYEEALHGYDIVLCDLIDGENNSISKGFRGPSFNDKNIIMYSTDPAFACNKLFKKELFKILKFPTHWYEDLGTTPILMTYSNRIGYVESPFYYYTQRQDSITSSTSDKTLGVIQAWTRVLENANSKYMDEANFAVYRSISAFINFKPMYVDKFIEFIRKNKLDIQKNQYYMEAVKNGEIMDLISLIAIPQK
ncbi:glycosyltransferase family 2 protein [Clostridium sp. CF012]|uniref:glycosyltransferase family 2 protein n=1 Tax=Clostridium sp. CF012 TaxID=2843319 RepID=UPI001C0D212A|nr:glycosyltransferase family 2 protein [Clostridium sp. CF012]MBU3143989.1 glycosyltransferase [Clostridium sp. CF012]